MCTRARVDRQARKEQWGRGPGLVCDWGADWTLELISTDCEGVLYRNLWLVMGGECWEEGEEGQVGV